jgi:hypothetical protein
MNDSVGFSSWRAKRADESALARSRAVKFTFLNATRIYPNILSARANLEDIYERLARLYFFLNGHHSEVVQYYEVIIGIPT